MGGGGGGDKALGSSGGMGYMDDHRWDFIGTTSRIRALILGKP